MVCSLFCCIFLPIHMVSVCRLTVQPFEFHWSHHGNTFWGTDGRLHLNFTSMMESDKIYPSTPQKGKGAPKGLTMPPSPLPSTKPLIYPQGMPYPCPTLLIISSVAEVQSRTAPENQNWLNWTAKFSSVLFSSPGSCACSVLSSHIWPSCQNWVRTGSNWLNWTVWTRFPTVQLHYLCSLWQDYLSLSLMLGLQQDQKTSVNIFCTIPTSCSKDRSPWLQVPTVPLYCIPPLSFHQFNSCKLH